jgi:uncharacterized protein (DUF4213/DUF364 family)
MSLIDELLTTLPDGEVWDVRVGVFWTAVVVELGGHRRCGLASTVRDHDDHHNGGGPALRDAGLLMGRSARELAELARSYRPMEAAIGLATINALLPAHAERWVDLNAGEVIAQHGADKRVALVGHFPFIPRLRDCVGALWVLEKRPSGEDLPAEAAWDVIPKADVVAITGTSLINHTFGPLPVESTGISPGSQHPAITRIVRPRHRYPLWIGGPGRGLSVAGRESGRQFPSDPPAGRAIGDYAERKNVER